MLISTKRQRKKTTTIKSRMSQKSCAKLRSSGSIIYLASELAMSQYDIAFQERRLKYGSFCLEHFGKGLAILTNTELPKPIGVFLCERVLRDVLKPDAITLVNLHNSMSVQAFPAIIPLVFAFSEVTGSHHEFSYQFKFVDRKEQVIAVSGAQMVAPLPNKNMTHKLVGAFQGLVFQEEGSYSVILSLNGEDCATLNFQIMQNSPPAVS